MKLILDFDRTLFAVERLYTALEAMGKPHLAGTMESINVLPLENYLYEDVSAFLQKYSKKDVFILSSASGLNGEWENDYQSKKIAATGIAEKVNEVVVVSGEKGVAAASIARQWTPPEKIVFVDDRIEHCVSVQAAVPNTTCCLMVRDKSVIGDVRCVQGIRVVHSLRDVNAIIESL